MLKHGLLIGRRLCLNLKGKKKASCFYQNLENSSSDLKVKGCIGNWEITLVLGFISLNIYHLTKFQSRRWRSSLDEKIGSLQFGQGIGKKIVVDFSLFLFFFYF